MRYFAQRWELRIYGVSYLPLERYSRWRHLKGRQWLLTYRVGSWIARLCNSGMWPVPTSGNEHVEVHFMLSLQVHITIFIRFKRMMFTWLIFLLLSFFFLFYIYIFFSFRDWSICPVLFYVLSFGFSLFFLTVVCFNRNLFFRTMALLNNGVLPVFVLEGDAPSMKWNTINSRNQRNFHSSSNPSGKNLSLKTGKRSRFKSVLKEVSFILIFRNTETKKETKKTKKS